MSKYKCPECNKCFKNRSGKSLCMRKHNNKDLVFQCPNCPRVYKDPSSLRKHKRLFEHSKDLKELESEVSNTKTGISETVVIPMNLSCHVSQSIEINENRKEILPKTTLPSIDTFAFNHSAIDCRINNSKDNQQNFSFPERALDLTSTFRPKVFINPCSHLSYVPSYQTVDDNLQYQYPINLTIQHQSNGYYAYDSQLPIDLSYHTFWNSNHNSQTMNFTSFLNSACPLDLTLDQPYSHEYNNNSHIGWIC